MDNIRVTYNNSHGETIEANITEEIVEKIKLLLSPPQMLNTEEKRLELNRRQRESYKKAKDNPDVINAHVYILRFGNNTYVGSTILSLNSRLNNHICMANKHNKEKTIHKLYNTLYQFDRNDISIKSLKFYRTISKIKLRFIEDHYINTLKPNMNTVSAVNNRLKKKYPQYIVNNDENTASASGS